MIPGHPMFNDCKVRPTCNLKPTEIPDAINLVSNNFNYDEVVNMKDVNGLHHIDFSDVCDLGKLANPVKAEKSSPPTPAKVVNFLDKFRDPKIIDETETWDIDQLELDFLEKMYLPPIRNTLLLQIKIILSFIFNIQICPF